MKREQIKLFDQTLVSGGELAPTTVRVAEIIPFPVDPGLVFTRLTARRLERRHGPAADKFWRTECSRLYAKLQVQGLTHDQIRGEVDRFALAVHDEMKRAAWAEWQDITPRPAA